MQDALEAAVEGDDKGKLEQHLQENEAQACLSLFPKSSLSWAAWYTTWLLTI